MVRLKTRAGTITNSSNEKYPDIAELIEKKKAHRRALAALPFEKKIEMVWKIRERASSLSQVES